MKEKTLWYVEQGAYSGKYIAAVFTSAEAAYQYAYSEGEGSVGEVDVDPISSKPRRLQRGQRLWHARMTTGGDGARASVADWWSEPSAGTYGQHQDEVSATIIARTKQEAIKILNERRTIWLATGKKTKKNPDNAYWPLMVLR